VDEAAPPSQPSPALLRVLTRDSDAIARIVKRYRTDTSLGEEELEVMRQHAHGWSENVEQLLS